MSGTKTYGKDDIRSIAVEYRRRPIIRIYLFSSNGRPYSFTNSGRELFGVAHDLIESITNLLITSFVHLDWLM